MNNFYLTFLDIFTIILFRYKSLPILKTVFMEVIPFLKQKILSFILFFTLAFCVLPFLSTEAHAQSTVITDSGEVSGSDYADSPALAQKLDDIFEGDAGVYYDYYCTSLVSTPLGSSPVKNNGIYMYASPVGDTAEDIGTSCWIYSQAVYHTLFGEPTNGTHSEDLYLGYTASRALTYSNLQAWGVRPMPGALIRASGHSMILLHYDADTITIVDGNGDGNGLVAVRVYSWDQMGEYVEYIIQPESSYYAKLYGWGMCGDGIFWCVDNNTLTISGSGELLEAPWNDYHYNIEKVVIKNGSVAIGDNVFQGCDKLQEILFLDAAPTLSDKAFAGVNASARYPAAKAGWTEDCLRSYGGSLNWIPYGMTELRITEQPQSVCTAAGTPAEFSINAAGDGLTYSWYMKKPEESVYVKSAVSGPVYAVTTAALFEDLQVICVVRDQYGNYVISQQANLHICEDNHSAAVQSEPLVRNMDTAFFPVIR